MNKKLLLLLLSFALMFLFVSCKECDSCPTYFDDTKYQSSETNVGEEYSEYLYEEEGEVWKKEMIDGILKYRYTDILPEAEGTYFEYKIAFRKIDIIVTGDINSYLNTLKSNEFRVPKKPSIAIPLIGKRSSYACVSKSDTLKAYVYPIDDEHFEIEATAKLPLGYSDKFEISKVNSRLDYLTYFYPDADPVSQYIIVPGGEVFTITPSNDEYFVVYSYVESGSYKEYEEELVTVGYVKDEEHKFHMENLGVDIYDINDENKSYKIKFYVREIPQFDYENYFMNYNNSNYGFSVLDGQRTIVFFFNKGTIYCNPIRTLGEDIEKQRTTLNYDRVGCTSPTMLHLYGLDQYYGDRYYDIIIDFSFFNNVIFIVQDSSYFIN